eukprot:SM000390S14724  [mRNA]  locus=s390:8642:11071:+ [translate_table: standard]
MPSELSRQHSMALPAAVQQPAACTLAATVKTHFMRRKRAAGDAWRQGGGTGATGQIDGCRAQAVAPHGWQPVKHNFATGGTTAARRSRGQCWSLPGSRTAAADAMDGSEEELTDLCIMELPSVHLPTSTGHLHVLSAIYGGEQIFQPKYLAMFDVVTNIAALAGTVPRFGVHLLHASRTEGQQFPTLHGNGFTLGCCCIVDGVKQQEDGSLMVAYSVIRRFRLIKARREWPFLVAGVQWVCDGAPSRLGPAVDRLEQEVWAALSEVARLTAELARPAAAPRGHRQAPQMWLPEPILAYCPAPLCAASSIHPNRRASEDIGIWRKARWPSGQGGCGLVGDASINSDPYWAAQEQLAKPARQEAFSFAAANMMAMQVEAAPDERLTLLEMQDTGKRLDWVLNAIGPHLASLRAQHILLQTLDPTK